MDALEPHLSLLATFASGRTSATFDETAAA